MKWLTTVEKNSKSHVQAVSFWGTQLNLPRVRFKRCGGSKQAVLREKLAHKAEENIRLSQTSQSIVIIISHGGGSCSECWFAHQVGDTIYFHRYPEWQLGCSTKVTVYASCRGGLFTVLLNTTATRPSDPCHCQFYNLVFQLLRYAGRLLEMILKIS